jgi:hypothetical protein
MEQHVGLLVVTEAGDNVADAGVDDPRVEDAQRHRVRWWMGASREVGSVTATVLSGSCPMESRWEPSHPPASTFPAAYLWLLPDGRRSAGPIPRSRRRKNNNRLLACRIVYQHSADTTSIKK